MSVISPQQISLELETLLDGSRKVLGKMWMRCFIFRIICIFERQYNAYSIYCISPSVSSGRKICIGVIILKYTNNYTQQDI